MRENAIIETSEVTIAYGARPAVQDFSFVAREGEITLLLGHNGAGKTTLLRGMFGLYPVKKGNIIYRGEQIKNRATEKNVKEGFVFVPQGHGVFPRLSVEDNLNLGAYHITKNVRISELKEQVCSLFPILAERRSQLAGTMSGGQQQMVAIGIALMQDPKLLVLDEPSIGLSPKLVGEVMQSILEIKERLGVSVLMVEQNISASGKIADNAIIMKTGRKVYDGSPDILKKHEALMEYF